MRVQAQVDIVAELYVGQPIRVRRLSANGMDGDLRAGISPDDIGGRRRLSWEKIDKSYFGATSSSSFLAKVVYLRMNQRHPQSRHTPHSVFEP